MSKIKDIILQLSGLYKIYGKKLENEIITGDIPNHIALILDGNRRWAKRHLEIKKKDIGKEQMQLKIYLTGVKNSISKLLHFMHYQQKI